MVEEVSIHASKTLDSIVVHIKVEPNAALIQKQADCLEQTLTLNP